MIRTQFPILFITACFAIPASARDVHVRVDPAAPSAGPGQENRTMFPTVQNALDHHPWPTDGGRVYIEIAPGIYHERILVTQNHPNITLVGLGAKPEDTVITNSLNARAAGGTFFTETVELNGKGFEADNLTFENAAGDTGQAVAVANRSDRSIFKNCRILGHQDTLFADYGRQYYVDTYIEGGVDYIFGDATAVFEDDELHSNGPGFVTAHSRTSAQQSTGYVILNSRITASLDSSPAPVGGEQDAANSAIRHGRVGLGRPWRPYARVVYIQTQMASEVTPGGWDNWGNSSNESTAYFAEFGSTGPGTSKSRVSWSHQLTGEEAKQYLPKKFLAGSDSWDAVAEAARLP
jgi:pectinesterase